MFRNLSVKNKQSFYQKPFSLFSLVFGELKCVWCVISSLLVCNIQRPRALERCVISDLSLGVSRSLSAASCVTIRSTYLEKLESFDSFLQGLSHLFQSIILGSHYVVSEQLWKGSVLISICSRFDLFKFSSSLIRSTYLNLKSVRSKCFDHESVCVLSYSLWFRG